MFRSYSRDVQQDIYTIIDDDFEDTGGNAYCYGAVRFSLTIHIIDVYEIRNLNVAHNLALGFRWFKNKYPNISLSDAVNDIKCQILQYHKYSKEVDKYLLLI